MGLFDSLKAGIGKVAAKVKEHNDKAPEREKKQIEDLQRKEKLLRARAGVMRQQNALRSEQQRGFSGNPLFNQSMSQGSNPFFGAPPGFNGAPVRKAQGSSKKRKPKRRVTEFY